MLFGILYWTKATGRNQEEGRDQCGVQERDGTERECDEGSVCLLEGILNLCIRSMSANLDIRITVPVVVYIALSPGTFSAFQRCMLKC